MIGQRIVLTGEPKSTQHIYRATCRGGFAHTYMTPEGKALKEQYQWEAKSQWKHPPLEGDISVRVARRGGIQPQQAQECGGRAQATMERGTVNADFFYCAGICRARRHRAGCRRADWRFGYCVEDVTPCEPDTLYGAAKDSLRRAFLAYCNVSGLSGSWGRGFFMYGPRENPSRLVSSVIISLLKGSPAKSSHGLQVRDYLHIQDVADGMVAVFASQGKGTYNIAASTSTTIREIVELLGKSTGRSDLLQIGALPARANDAPLVLGDGRRTLSDTGWKPKLTLQAGLSATVDWWRVHLNSREG